MSAYATMLPHQVRAAHAHQLARCERRRAPVAAAQHGADEIIDGVVRLGEQEYLASRRLKQRRMYGMGEVVVLPVPGGPCSKDTGCRRVATARCWLAFIKATASRVRLLASAAEPADDGPAWPWPTDDGGRSGRRAKSAGASPPTLAKPARGIALRNAACCDHKACFGTAVHPKQASRHGERRIGCELNQDQLQQGGADVPQHPDRPLPTRVCPPTMAVSPLENVLCGKWPPAQRRRCASGRRSASPSVHAT